MLGLQSNALKFTTKGFVKVIVRIIEDESSRENELEISVVDSGIGISD